MTTFKTLLIRVSCGLAFLTSFQAHANSNREIEQIQSHPSEIINNHTAVVEYEPLKPYEEQTKGCSISDPRCSAMEKL